jgi:hypothetical protein
MGQGRHDVGGAQELAPRACERAGRRVGCAPLGDDVVEVHVLHAEADRNEVGGLGIAPAVLGMHGVEQAVGRELGVEGETDEAALQAVVDRHRKDSGEVGIDLRLIVRVDPIQQPARVVGEAAAVGQVAHVADTRPGVRRNVLVGGSQPAGVGQPRQILDLDGEAALHHRLGNRVFGDRLVGGADRRNGEQRDDAKPHPGSHERLHDVAMESSPNHVFRSDDFIAGPTTQQASNT